MFRIFQKQAFNSRISPRQLKNQKLLSMIVDDIAIHYKEWG